LKSRFDILDYLRRKVQKGELSVLWITHLFDEVQESDTLAIIHKGKILQTGKVEAIIAEHKQADLTQTFRYLTRENPDA